jgi:hypothetical protein
MAKPRIRKLRNSGPAVECSRALLSSSSSDHRCFVIILFLTLEIINLMISIADSCNKITTVVDEIS